MTEQEINDRLEVLRKKKVQLNVSYEMLSKSSEYDTKQSLIDLKKQIDEINIEYRHLLLLRSQFKNSKTGKNL